MGMQVRFLVRCVFFCFQVILDKAFPNELIYRFDIANISFPLYVYIYYTHRCLVTHILVGKWVKLIINPCPNFNSGVVKGESFRLLTSPSNDFLSRLCLLSKPGCFCDSKWYQEIFRFRDVFTHWWHIESSNVEQRVHINKETFQHKTYM